MIKFEHFIKGPLTSILGFVVMVFAFISWYNMRLEAFHALTCGAIGFALLFMRDKLPGFISRFIGGLLRKNSK